MSHSRSEGWICQLTLIVGNLYIWRKYERRNNLERISKNGMGSR